MAEKHKSKYKKPENKKPTYRKDIKDYTMDNKDGNLNPKSAGEKIPNLLRKTDKEMQDDGKMYPTYNADDRLYKDLEDGDYDPKTALKRMKKRQDTEEKDVLKDKIENLTREQKERLVREYVRRKLINRLVEAAPGEEPEIEELPMDAPEAEVPAAEPTAEVPTETPAPEAPAPTAEVPAEAPAETPAPDANAEMDAPAKEALAIERFSNHLKEEGGNISRLKSIAKVLNATFRESEPEDVQNFYRMLKTFTIKKLANK